MILSTDNFLSILTRYEPLPVGSRFFGGACPNDDYDYVIKYPGMFTFCMEISALPILFTTDKKHSWLKIPTKEGLNFHIHGCINFLPVKRACAAMSCLFDLRMERNQREKIFNDIIEGILTNSN